jgi:hypothetical protein
MRNLLYLMMFQMVLGLLLIISPFVLGFWEITIATTFNIILGAIVFILSLIETAYFQEVLPWYEHAVKKRT